ncbi:hypothetical protein Slin14017_G060560 [Septoria linicola]|nr:hypothetical protein Slin14017_G060560 [Septoria linicola]
MEFPDPIPDPPVPETNPSDLLTSHVVPTAPQTQPTSTSLSPANGTTYTTPELTTLFTTLESRLTGYAESLLGVARCLDSLQEQITAFRDQQGRGSESGSERGEGEEEDRRGDGGGDGAGEKHAVREEECEGQRSIGVGERLRVDVVGREGEEEWRGGEGGGERLGGGEKPENGGDGEVNDGGLGNMLSGFVFGDDPGKS